MFTLAGAVNVEVDVGVDVDIDHLTAQLEPGYWSSCIGGSTIKIEVDIDFKIGKGCWSFMYERWSSGTFFTQTKPPTGLPWTNYCA